MEEEMISDDDLLMQTPGFNVDDERTSDDSEVLPNFLINRDSASLNLMQTEEALGNFQETLNQLMQEKNDKISKNMSENENKAAVVDLANLEEENSSELPDSFSKNEKEEFRKTQKKILFKTGEEQEDIGLKVFLIYVGARHRISLEDFNFSFELEEEKKLKHLTTDQIAMLIMSRGMQSKMEFFSISNIDPFLQFTLCLMVFPEVDVNSTHQTKDLLLFWIKKGWVLRLRAFINCLRYLGIQIHKWLPRDLLQRLHVCDGISGRMEQGAQLSIVVDDLLEVLNESLSAHPDSIAIDDVISFCVIICVISLDSMLIKQKFQHSATAVLSTLLNMLPASTFHMKSWQLCSYLLTITSSHQDFGHLFSVWPIRERGCHMQRILSASVLRAMTENSSDGLSSALTEYRYAVFGAVTLSDVNKLVAKFVSQSHKDPYFIHSALILIELCVTNDIFADINGKKILGSLKNSLSKICCGRVSLSNSKVLVKNRDLIKKITTKWHLMILESN